MRFGVFIVALLACEVAHAQTPLPRSRPHAASDVTARAEIVKTKLVLPMPRARPSEAPAAKQATTSAPEKSETRVTSVPVPRERPAAAMARIVEAVLAATQSEPKAEPKSSEQKPPEQKSEPAVVASIPVPPARPAEAVPRPVQKSPVEAAPVQTAPAPIAKPETPPAEAVVTKPAPSIATAPPAPKEEASPPAPKAEAAPETPKAEAAPAAPREELAPRVASTPVESPRAVPQETTASTSSSPAIIAVPPPASQNHDTAPMEEPVPPLASPPAPAGTPQQIVRLEPKPAAPPLAAVAPPVTVELPKLDPPPGEHTMQVAQLPPSLVAFLKKLPIPKKRPLSAWPRPDDLVFHDVTANSPDAECDAALNSGILIAERLNLGRRGSCYVPHAVKVEAIMVGRKRVDIVPPAKLRCGFALAIANWVRADFAPAATSLGTQLVGLRQLDSYNCRTMSSSRRMMSEHSMGNALDVAEVILAGHHRAHLTDRNTQKAFRARLRSTACKRFKTVLGPGVPQHHDHIHVDLRKHYGPGGICHWNVL